MRKWFLLKFLLSRSSMKAKRAAKATATNNILMFNKGKKMAVLT